MDADFGNKDDIIRWKEIFEKSFGILSGLEDYVDMNDDLELLSISAKHIFEVASMADIFVLLYYMQLMKSKMILLCGE